MIGLTDLSTALAEAQPVDHLVVVTASDRRGRHGLALTFRDATVIVADADGALDTSAVLGPADAVAVEAPAAATAWTIAVIGAVRNVLRDGGYVVVMFPPELAGDAHADRVPAGSAGDLSGLQVVSSDLLNDTVCLVLRPVEADGDQADHAGSVATTVSATGRAVHLEALARARGTGTPVARRAPHAAGGAKSAMSAELGHLRSELRRLNAALASERHGRAQAERRYQAHRHSLLGRITVRYWELRRRLVRGTRR